MFRSRSIFRTLVYFEPKTYRKLSNIYNRTLCKNSYTAHFLASLLKMSSNKNPALKSILIFRETEFSLIFQEVTFRARKKIMFYILVNETFYPQD